MRAARDGMKVCQYGVGWYEMKICKMFGGLEVIGLEVMVLEVMGLEAMGLEIGLEVSVCDGQRGFSKEGV